jgi:cytochrome c oxidase cbb3-type subunit 3
MPAFASTLGDRGVENVLAALRSWQEHAAFVTRPPRAPPPPIPLGPVPLFPRGPEPVGFRAEPKMTPADVVKAQLDRHARFGVLDARAPSDYLLEHIAGSVSVPFYDPDTYAAALPKDAWLVCYCACPHAESETLALKLVAKGFTKITVLDEGLWVWKDRKYPTRKGVDP